jgi:transcriptional regulator with XRE-family HTH domain
MPLTSSPPETDAASETSMSVLASKLRLLRRQSEMTLQQLSQRCGISASTLSKIENGQLSPTYEKIAALAKGLEVNVGELFSAHAPAKLRARRSVMRVGDGVRHATPQYLYEMLHSDLSDKRFIPLLTTVKAHARSDFPKLLSHDGEEMLYVLSGRIVVHSDSYAPLELGPGDSCYFDSNMGHACLSASDVDAQVLWICSHATLHT